MARMRPMDRRNRYQVEPLERRLLLAGNLVFADDFNLPAGAQPNGATWTLGYQGTDPNNQAVAYTNDSGTLHVIDDPGANDGKALQMMLSKNANGSFSSARITTRVNPVGGSLKYGHIEARIKLPGGPNGQDDGIWPAFWMLGNDIGQVGWPACGEVDIMEHLGDDSGNFIGTIHGPGYINGNGVANINYHSSTPLYLNYHTFAIDWGPNYIHFYFDGNYLGTRSPPDLANGSPWVFNHPFYVILNICVAPWSVTGQATYPQTMLVDYVRATSLDPVANVNLPAGWSGADIGAPPIPGVHGFDGSTWTIGGNGTDIWNNRDQFHYTSAGVRGDFSAVARVTGMWDAADYAKAGLMVRDGTAADAKYAFAVVTPNHGKPFEGAGFEYRSVTGANAQGAGSAPAGAGAAWVKVVRAGNTFTGFWSPDGLNWQQNGAAQTIQMGMDVRVGLAVDSNNLNNLNVATFTNVSILPAGWTNVEVGAPGKPGSANYNPYGGAWSVAGGGADIWNAADQFHFVRRSLAGDGTVVARVGSLTNTDPWAKAGVMLRNDDTAGSAFANVNITPANGAVFEWRAGTGGTAASATVPGVKAGAWVKLTRTGNTFAGYYSNDGTTWTQIGAAQTVALGATALAGLAVTAHNNAALAAATFTNASVLPAGWSDVDVGPPGPAGSATFDAATGLWTVAGSGADIWGAADGFHFASRPFTGNGSITARVNSLWDTNPWAKAGVMFREDNAPGAAFADVVLTPGNGVCFQWRSATGAAAASATVAGVTGPVWVRLTRTGDTFTGAYSADGSTWTPIGTPQTIVLSATSVVGLAVTAHDAATLSSATFGNVRLETSPPTVKSVQVNGGGAQRSMLTTIAVTFDQAVVPDAGAFTVVGRNGVGVGTIVSAASPVANAQGAAGTWFLSFSGPPVIGNSLADGIYDLTVVGSKIHAATSTGPTMAVDYHAPAFHRLFSDADGDGDSDNADLFVFRTSYNKPSTDPMFRAEFDYDNDVDVDNADLLQVRNRRAVEFKGY